MSYDLTQTAHQLTDAGLLGKLALRYGAPDKTMLISGGPPSHLAQWSLLAGPSKKRVMIRQPSRDLLPAAEVHSPLNGELHLVSDTPLLKAEVEEWKHGSWYHSVTLRALNIEDLLGKLKAETPIHSFDQPHQSSFPNQPFWTGALAYDLVQWTQPLRLQHPPAEGALLAVLWLITDGVVQHHATGDITVFGNDEMWCKLANEALQQSAGAHELPPPTQAREAVTHTDETHQDNIEAVRQGITRGQVYQVNIGKHWQGDIDHPYDVFRRLMRINPAPYAAYVEAEDIGFALASSSPESLLHCDEGSVRTSPIKGTCPQGADDEESEGFRKAMILDEKERAEHRMLVDLMRNDLTQFSDPGTIEVNRFDVESYANVQHLVSHISASFSEGANGNTALQSIFPGGSITGCPRTVVCAVIDELEQMPRSFWTGSVGYIDVHSGKSAWNILIRTLEAHRKGSAWKASVGAGGGITIASLAQKEVEEAAWKGAALRVAAGWMREEHVALPTGTLNIYPVESSAKKQTTPSCGSIRTLSSVLNHGGQTGVLFIDNLDSFSLNIADAMAQAGHHVTILEGRSPASERFLDPVALHELFERIQPTHLVLGPGPGQPSDCPLTMALAHHALAGQLDMPVLGICLGHQALAEADGWQVAPSAQGPVHGVPTRIHHDGTGLFESIAEPTMILTRYNSLVASKNGDHALVENASEEETGLNMGLRHPVLPIHSLQVHPESIGSLNGSALLEAFLRIQSDG